jgi:hypothetical protein
MLKKYLSFWRPFICLIASISNFNSVYASGESIQTGIHNQYQSLRAMGMGGAFAAVADGESLLFYNPAGLARITNSSWNFSLGLAGAKSFTDFTKDAEAVGKVQGTDEDKFNAATQFLQNRYGEMYSLRTNLFEGVYIRPKWGIAVVPFQFTVNMSVHDQVVPAIDMKGYIDSTVAAGFGRDWKGVPGRLSWGVAGKFINRGYLAKQINSLDLVSESSNLLNRDDAREGYTIDADLGILYSPYLPSEGWGYSLHYAKPTFAFVIRNALDMGFKNSLKLINKEQASEAPERLYRVFDFGSKFEFPKIWIFNGRAAFDVRDIGHPSFTTRRGFHLGLELDWTMTSWWKGQYRFGINQGYPTFGFSALLAIFRLDLATYGQEIGTFDSPKENRIYEVKLNIDI